MQKSKIPNNPQIVSAEIFEKEAELVTLQKGIRINVAIFWVMSESNMEYKNAMERLEEILTKIDHSDMGIDELATQVQEAAVLLRRCRQILIETEKNVQEAFNSLNGELDSEG